MKDNGSGDVDDDPSRPPVLEFAGMEARSRKRREPLEVPDIRSVRTNLLEQGRGVIKPPAPYRTPAYQPRSMTHLPALPPKHVADLLLRQYHSSVHQITPVLHWPSFSRECENLYRNGTLQAVAPPWGSLFFSVLACGVLHNVEASEMHLDQGKVYLEASRILINLWTDDFTLDHARAALLTSVFLTEMNMKSAAWVWLGSALRMAQDIGLHHDIGTWSAIEAETRRRVWWAVYVRDR